MSDIFKGLLKYSGWVFFFISLWFKSCSDSKGNSVQIQEVVTPKIEAKFASKKPNHNRYEMPKKRPAYAPNKTLNTSYAIDYEIIEMTKKNEKDIENFKKANDSLKKELYERSIALNKFSTTFDDGNLTLNINGIVKGEVQEITPSYVIKEKKISVEVKPKKTVFRFLAGIEAGNSIGIYNFIARANLMFQNKNGNIISASIDTNNTIWVGYNLSIFNIKR